MPPVGVFNQVIGLLAKAEAVQGTPETLSNSLDGCLWYIGEGDPPPPKSVDYVFDGSLGRAPGVLAPQKRVQPNGAFRENQFLAIAKGIGGSGYTSGTVYPPQEIHRWLQAAGFDATFSTNKWIYTPTGAGAGYTTLTVREFAQGNQYDSAGVIADLSIDAQGLGAPVWTFDWRGLASLPANQSLPTITYTAPAVIPPVASGVIANIGTFEFAKGALRRLNVRMNRQITEPRPNQTLPGGHAGFVPGAMAPTIDVEMEATAFVGTPFHTVNGVDGEALKAAATSVDLSFQYGTTAGNKYTIGTAQAQCTNVDTGGSGPLGIVTLTFTCHASTASTNDAIFIEFA